MKRCNFANTHFRLCLPRRKLATSEREHMTTTAYSKWNSVCLFWHLVATIHVILWREEPVTSCWFGQRHQTYILVKISLSLFGNQTNGEKQTRVSFHVFSSDGIGFPNDYWVTVVNTERVMISCTDFGRYVSILW